MARAKNLLSKSYSVNPLRERFEDLYFKNLPQLPGVYRFIGQDAQLLYVGKAKNLKRRLMSYRTLRKSRATRKVMRLLKLIQFIEFEIHETETAALLRENELLRSLKPPFNVMNTYPESYYVIGISRIGQGIRLKLQTAAMEREEAYEYFGVYRGRGFLRDSFLALLRLLWFSFASGPMARLPTQLLRDKPLYEWTFQPQAHVMAEGTFLDCLRDFLVGRSPLFLEQLSTTLVMEENVPKIFEPTVQEDLRSLLEFFQTSCKRNFQLSELYKVEKYFIEYDLIDDLIVRFRTGDFSASP